MFRPYLTDRRLPVTHSVWELCRFIRILVLVLCGWSMQSVQADVIVDPFLHRSEPNLNASQPDFIGTSSDWVSERTTAPPTLSEVHGHEGTGLESMGLEGTGLKVTEKLPAATGTQPPLINLARWTQSCGAQKKLRPGWSLGGFQVTPYGALWADMIYQTRRTTPGHFTLYVPSREVQGENASYVDMRRTRLGLDVAGPRIGAFAGALSKGRVEIDFQGAFITENQPKARLRHAYWEVGDEDFRLLVGQTWDVISPLNPGMLNFSVGWMGGNIGFRRAQVRTERYWHPADRVKLSLQASVNESVSTDFVALETDVRREATGWPTVEGRTAISWDHGTGTSKQAEIGFSGHIGETGFDFLATGPPPLNLPPADDARFRTWSFNIDGRLPNTHRFGVQGEFFTGANLSTFLGGIGQGVCPCIRVPIRSTGGWADFWFDWSDRLHSHVGYGVDDPNDKDSLLGRTYNQFLFANITYDVTEKLLTGFEVTSWKTLYHERRVGLIPPDQLIPTSPGESIVVQWMMKYGF
jgi:hypothetical protein